MTLQFPCASASVCVRPIWLANSFTSRQTAGMSSRSMVRMIGVVSAEFTLRSTSNQARVVRLLTSHVNQFSSCHYAILPLQLRPVLSNRVSLASFLVG